MEHFKCALPKNALYTELTNREKLLIFYLQSTKRVRPFALLPVSFAAELRVVKPDPLMRVALELDEQGQVVESKTNS